jgi:hypothetical protein
METSAKTGINSQQLFIEATKILYKDYLKYNNIENNANKNNLKLTNYDSNNFNDEKNNRCC